LGDTWSNYFTSISLNDLIIELDEQYTVSVAGATVVGGRDVQRDPVTANRSVTDTIVNDDSGTINIVPSWVVNGGETTADALEGEWGAKYFRLILKHDEFPSAAAAGIDVPVTVKWKAVDGNAEIGGSGPGANDYAGGTITYDANGATGSEGEVTGSTYDFGALPIAILDDSVAEQHEMFQIDLVQLVWPPTVDPRAVSLGNSSVSPLIRGDDYATLSITGGGTTTEGNSGFIDTTFSVSLVGRYRS